VLVHREVDVSVNDVHLPSDDDNHEQAPPWPSRVTPAGLGDSLDDLRVGGTTRFIRASGDHGAHGSTSLAVDDTIANRSPSRSTSEADLVAAIPRSCPARPAIAIGRG
jgi:hypothetical protein